MDSKRLAVRREWNGVEAAWRQMLVAIIHALESKDPFGRGHSARVAAYATQLASIMGLPVTEVAALELAALLHDIGKAAIPGHILQKPGRLTSAEYRIVQAHPALGASMLRSVFANREPRILDVALYHHEAFDGTGYPEGLAGEAIPLWGRICCVVDAWDAMTTPRPYRETFAIDQAVTELRRCRKTHFDPDLVDLFVDRVIPSLTILGSQISGPSLDNASLKPLGGP